MRVQRIDICRGSRTGASGGLIARHARIAGGCPVIGSAAAAAVNPSNQMPYEGHADGQSGRLQTGRQASNIPIGDNCAAPAETAVLQCS